MAIGLEIEAHAKRKHCRRFEKRGKQSAYIE
jgi:hypothetical protein